MKKQLSRSWMLVIIVAILILDQVTKYITKTSMFVGESFPVLGNFFRITYVENPGMAFGITINSPIFFMILSLIAAVLVFYYLFRVRNENWLLQLALCFISAGAIGNLSDRIIRGQVVDFFDFEFFDIFIPSFQIFSFDFSGYALTRWPVFNIADMAVSGGMIILILYIIFIGDPLKPSPAPSAEQADG